jgi:hypothetical protein
VHLSDGSSDICRFNGSVSVRAWSKEEAVAGSVVGGTMVSTTGAAAATQIGIYLK